MKGKRELPTSCASYKEDHGNLEQGSVNIPDIKGLEKKILDTAAVGAETPSPKSAPAINEEIILTPISRSEPPAQSAQQDHTAYPFISMHFPPTKLLPKFPNCGTGIIF